MFIIKLVSLSWQALKAEKPRKKAKHWSLMRKISTLVDSADRIDQICGFANVIIPQGPIGVKQEAWAWFTWKREEHEEKGSSQDRKYPFRKYGKDHNTKWVPGITTTAMPTRVAAENWTKGKGGTERGGQMVPGAPYFRRYIIYVRRSHRL